MNRKLNVREFLERRHRGPKQGRCQAAIPKEQEQEISDVAEIEQMSKSELLVVALDFFFAAYYQSSGNSIKSINKAQKKGA